MSEKPQLLLQLFQKIKSEKLSETLLREFVSHTKTFSSEKFPTIVSLNFAAATREAGQPKTLTELGGSIQKGGAYKKGTQNRGGHSGGAGSYGNSGKSYGGGYGRGKQSDRDANNSDFNRGARGQDSYNNRDRYHKDPSGPEFTPQWRQDEDEMVLKLKEKARQNIEATKVEKDNTQTVRLWLNQITPDNYAKKSFELRGLLFGDRKIKDEPGYEEQVGEF